MIPGRRYLFAVAALVLACRSDPVIPPVDGCPDDDGISGALSTLGVYEGLTLTAEQVAECVLTFEGGARYLLVPQYATPDNVPASVADGRPSFLLGATAGGGPVAALAALPVGTAGSPQQRLDLALRQREQGMAPMAARAAEARRASPPSLGVQMIDETRTFKVLADLRNDQRFDTVIADLRFAGDHILIYVDRDAPAGGFTNTELERLGRLFDQKLFDLAVDAFGQVSDIDGNGHVVVLLTPVVNKLTTAAECRQSGFVTGFFYGLDLTPTLANSNKGEIFYSVVPDPAGATGSCAHSVAEVNRLVPATFIHELQHMISWNQHVIIRGGRSEALWLNEGLSHVAEELASLAYERDPTQPRTTPEQLFPDSSQGFITGNVSNAYSYLESSRNTSLTQFRDFGSLEERGAAWLFLRWLGDQKGDGIYRQLVESRLTGVANIEDRAGEPFRRLFADFSVAAYVSHPPGGSQSAVPERYRFVSRDFRRIFRRFFDTSFEGIGRPFPIVATRLLPSTTSTGSMLPGTMTWFELATPAVSDLALSFGPSAGGSFNGALGAQLTILRLPTQ